MHPIAAMNKKSRYHLGHTNLGGRHTAHYFAVGSAITWLAYAAREEMKMMGVGMSEHQKAARRAKVYDPAVWGMAVWRMNDGLGLTADWLGAGSSGILGLDPFFPDARSRGGGVLAAMAASAPAFRTADNLLKAGKSVVAGATGHATREEVIRDLYNGIAMKNLVGVNQTLHNLLGIK